MLTFDYNLIIDGIDSLEPRHLVSLMFLSLAEDIWLLSLIESNAIRNDFTANVVVVSGSKMGSCAICLFSRHLYDSFSFDPSLLGILLLQLFDLILSIL